MLCVGLADEYKIPVSDLLRRWTVREIIQIFIVRRRRRLGEERALKQQQQKAKPAKPKEQTPDEMLAALEA